MENLIINPNNVNNEEEVNPNGFTVPQFDPLTVQYERNIPKTVEEAMHEMDKRVMHISQLTGGQVNFKKVVYELLIDFEKGLEDKSPIIVPPMSIY